MQVRKFMTFKSLLIKQITAIYLRGRNIYNIFFLRFLIRKISFRGFFFNSH